MEKAHYAGARDARNGEESVKRRPRRFLPVAFAAMTIAAAAAHAKTTAWIGTESGPLSTAAKWNNGLPEAGDSIVISNVAGAAISVVNDLEALEYNALRLHGANAINLSGEPFTLTGSVEMKAGGSVVDNFITNTSSTAKLEMILSTCSCTFNGDVVRTKSAATYLTEGPGTLTLNGRLVVPSTVFFRPRNSQTIRCNGPVIVTKCDATYENPFYGLNYLSSTENKIGTLNLNYYSFILEKDNVLSPDTVISFTGHEDRGDLRLNGHSQVANRLVSGSARAGRLRRRGGGSRRGAYAGLDCRRRQAEDTQERRLRNDHHREVGQWENTTPERSPSPTGRFSSRTRGTRGFRPSRPAWTCIPPSAPTCGSNTAARRRTA